MPLNQAPGIAVDIKRKAVSFESSKAVLMIAVKPPQALLQLSKTVFSG
jgi:hypothetical protein